MRMVHLANTAREHDRLCGKEQQMSMSSKVSRAIIIISITFINSRLSPFGRRMPNDLVKPQMRGSPNLLPGGYSEGSIERKKIRLIHLAECIP